jgi:hypothetical protein
MTNITVNALPTYSGSTDHSVDILPIYDASTTSTVGVSINNLLSVSSQPVAINDVQTLTNKTITSPIISGPTFSGTLIGTYTIGGTPTFPASVVTLTGSQTLTNKILTSPTINSATISNPTLTVDTITGYSVSTNVTVGSVTLQNGAVGGTTGTFSGLLTASNGFTMSSGTFSVPNNTITAPMLATSAITLGYAQITSNSTATSTTAVAGSVPIGVTVTIPAGGRRVKVTALAPLFSNGGSTQSFLSIWSGTVGSGTQLQEVEQSGIGNTIMAVAIYTPSAGSITYNVGIRSAAGTQTITCSSTAPAFILVEAI